MFKPGELAGTKDGKTVTVLSGLPVEGKHRWPVNTSAGIFEETDLFVAHPAVLITASGRDRNAEAFQARMKVSDPKEDAALDDIVARFKIMDQVQKILAKVTVEWNGHWRNGEAIRKEFRTGFMKDAYFHPGAIDDADAEAILKAPKHLLDRWVPVDVMDFRTTLRACSCCGEEDFVLETNGKVIRISGPPCKYPDGLPPNEWELNVPSGKLAVANDLRELFPLPEDEEFDINSNIGCRLTTLAYAANGLAHAFVGNTCPGVYQCENGVLREHGLFKIANPPSKEKWSEKRKAYVPFKPKKKFEDTRVAGICTDLWWYSICDHDEFKRRCKRFGQKPSGVEVIDVPPGVYRFHHYDPREDGGHEERIFSYFKWVREPDPVKDFLANYEAVDVNPHAFVQAKVVRWPTLYGATKRRQAKIPWSDMTEEERASSWQRIADHIFCVTGGGVEWHEKGFPKAKVDPSIPDVEPPSFRAQHHWYPFSKSYGGLFLEKLTPSFAKLAFRVLESVISFGTNVHDGEHSREVPYVRERMLLAVTRYRELVKRYPEQADPEYVAWLSQKGRAEAWVKNFDLGPEFTEKHKKHAEKQRWVPSDAYAVEFDARELKDGHFAWHPKKGGCWAAKKDAQRYAILEWSDNKQPAERNCCWTSHATNTSVPLYSVARVTKVGDVSHTGETLVEVAFDYGTAWMRDATKRKALAEAKEKAGIRVLTKEEYEALLPKAEEFFKDAEAAVK